MLVVGRKEPREQIQKGKDSKDFEKEIRENWEILSHENPEDFLMEVVNRHKEGSNPTEFLFFLIMNLYKDWKLNSISLTQLFRFQEKEYDQKIILLRKILDKEYKFEDSKINQTLGILIRIRYMLFSFFEEHDSEIIFLLTKNEMIGEKSPMELMIDQNLSEEDGLNRALKFIEYFCNPMGNFY